MSTALDHPVDVPAPVPALAAPAGPPPPQAPRRSGVVMVGTLLVITAGVMLFAGLLGSYLATREAVTAAGGAWPSLAEGASLPNVQLAMAYLTLGMTSFTAQWAVAAIAGDDRRNLYAALGIHFLLAIAFVNALAFSFTRMGLVAGGDAYANRVYAVSVTHLVFVFAAMVLWVVLAFRALGGQFSARNTEFVRAAATFWHFVVLTGAFVWFTLWLLEGGPNA